MRNSGLRLALFAGTALALAAQALPPEADSPQSDPPSRVARLNYQSGPVSFRPGSVDEWTAATINYPLTTGDHLWTDAGGFTELHVGSTGIRMAPQTALAILNLDDRTTQLSLTEGTLHIRVRELPDMESFEVDTPNAAITLLRPGEYHIEADGNNNVTVVSALAGDAQVTGSGVAFTVHSRESGRVLGTDQVSQEILPAPPITQFDDWCEQRDRYEDQAQVSERYVPRDMIGYEDLDRNGVWSEEPNYGYVWRPTVVDAGWAPYRYGHWAWVEPWGWTWIDDAPWGFAPFHYGRWVMAGGFWVWAPGRMARGARPVYAPALVAFVGGPRFGVAVGVGGGMAAWFPLGPGEVYRPAYHVSDVYVRRVNIMQVRDVSVVNARYVNQGLGVTVVSRETFVGARPVGRGIVAVDRREIVAAPVALHPGIVPERASVLARVGPGVAAPPARFVGRTVVVRATPPPPRVAFDAEQRGIAANGGRPLPPAQVERFRATSPVRGPMVRQVAAPQATPMRDTRPGFRGNPDSPAPEATPMRNGRPGFRGNSNGAVPEAAPAPIRSAPAAQQDSPRSAPPPAAQPAPERNQRPNFGGAPNRPAPEAAPVRSERPAPAAQEARPTGNARDTRKESRPGKRDERNSERKENR